MTKTEETILPTNTLSKTLVGHIGSFLFKDAILFKSPLQQKNRLLRRLAEYVAADDFHKVNDLYSLRPDLRVEILFALGSLAAQKLMKTILMDHPEDLLLYRPLKDLSGVYFQHISLFQHVLWTKDVRYMAHMMLDCLPNNAKGEEIRLEMVRQYEEFMRRDENDRHFSLQALIAAIETYVTNFDHSSFEELEKLYNKIEAERELLPAHIRHHYSDREIENNFWDNPSFQAPTFARFSRALNLQDSSVIDKNNFFNKRPWTWLLVPPRIEVPTRDEAQSELTSLKRLDAIRTQDMKELIQRLYTPIQNLQEAPALKV